MIKAVIKCFRRSTVKRIEENSAVYVYYIVNIHGYGHGEMRNKQLIIRRKDITKGWELCSLYYRLGKGREKKLLHVYLIK